MKTSLLLLALITATPMAVAQIDVHVPGVNVPNPGPNDLAIDTNRNSQIVTCKSGGGLFIRGNNNSLQVNGNCTVVHVMGNNNTVHVARTGKLVIEGNRNTVGYRDSKTEVSTLGSNNTVGPVQ